ncbi:hypothetical protein BGZ94_002688 [Podila epigama]|nr:hypothetical protein BGZ94_002688 [Podila epigama]
MRHLVAASRNASHNTPRFSTLSKPTAHTSSVRGSHQHQHHHPSHIPLPRRLAPLTLRRALATVTDTLYGVTAARVGKSTNAHSNDFFAQHTEQLATVDPEFATNPILHWSTFPDFAAIRPEHVVPAMTALVAHVQDQFAQRSQQFEPTWAGTMGLTQDLEDDLERASGVITHLSMVKDSPELRAAVEAIQPMIVKISLKMGQSPEFYDALVKMRNNPTTWHGLDKEQQRIVEKTIQSMKLSGVGFALLSEAEGGPEKRKRFNEIQERKAQLSLKFSNNIQDATKAFAKIVHDKKDLEGCPESLIQAMAKNARKRGHGHGSAETGPWAVTLDAPTLVPFMMNCKNRALREEVYRANVKRASEGEQDNEPIINEILSLRQEEASMLGFDSFGALSLSKKMASNVTTATEVLERLYQATLPAAQRELVQLTEFAHGKLNHPTPLRPWDTAFVGEEYRKDRFKYSADQISEYLVFPKVMDTMFAVAKDTFGIEVNEMTQEEKQSAGLTTWNKDVKVYKVEEDASSTAGQANEVDNGGKKKLLAYFYGDFYSRSEEKKSGAWMDVCVTRMKDPASGHVRVPIAYMICNQPPPAAEMEPSRMKFQDVTTLFHEFGHCLQHMLTTVDYPQASGIKGVEWDFVEVASQFMENFCHEPQWLNRMAAHYKTGAAMPKEMQGSVLKSREVLAGLAMMRQLHFATLDLELHTNFDAARAKQGGESVFDVDQRMAKRTCLVTPIPEDRFLCGFSHIFGGGYAAGYYSYKYSELYSADAYAALEEQSTTTARRAIGKKYRDTVLAYGGATDPKLVWKEFRGREGVEVDALLRHSGLSA